MKLAALLGLVFVFLRFADSQSSKTLKYVRPTQISPPLCPLGEQCLTLNEYASNSSQHFLSNTTLIFLQGDHHLDVNVQLENLQNISLLGESKDTVVISLSPQASFSWINCDSIEIDSILLKVAKNPLVFVNSIGIQISNTTFTGGSGAIIGCSALLLESSTAQISDSQFVGLSGQLSAVLVTSQSQVSFSGSNVFANNTAKLGGIILSVNSEVTILGTNQFTNNHATVWNTDLLDQCSNYSFQAGVTATSNISDGFGGAIYAEKSNLDISGNFSFVNNSAEVSGGAVAIVNNSTLTIETTLISPIHSIYDSINASFIQNRVIPGANFREGMSFYSNHGSGGLCLC